MKKMLYIFLILIMLPWGFVSPVEASSEVCGVDGNTYASEAEALAADVEVAYAGECKVVSSEVGLTEAKQPINFAGVLIEIGTTELPTTIIVADNKTKVHYTVEVESSTILGKSNFGFTSLSDWIPGDQIRVIGELNKNTNTVTAQTLINLSFLPRKFRGINGWITNIDKEQGKITYTWMQKERTVRVTDRTKIVAGLKNPATLDDLQIGDRIRGRTFVSGSEGDPEAKIIVVLRRGKNLFMKIRTFIPKVELVRINSTVVPTTLQVKILPTPTLRKNDVNNLIGTEGTLVTVNVTEDTILVRKYFGRTTLAEFTPGDVLHIVGRVNDDGTVDAKLIKNESIWQTQLFGHVGIVKEVNLDQSYLMMDWYPIRYLPKVKLKHIIKSKASEMQAQVLPTEIDGMMNSLPTSYKEKIQERLKQVRQRLRQAKQRLEKSRKIIIKKIKSERIKRSGIKLGDVIKKMPAKEMKVSIKDSTVIMLGGKQVGLVDISIGDRILVRGVRHKSLPLIEAEKIVIFPSLPEIDDDPSVDLDEINEVVEEIVEETVSEVETEIEDIIEIIDSSLDENDADSSAGDSDFDGNSRQQDSELN